MSQADFWQHNVSAEANRQLHAGATCALLPKKHQAAWHRPDNPKRSTGDTGAKSFSTKKQAEWKMAGNTMGTELRLGGNAAERRARGTGVAQSNRKDWNQSVVCNEDSRIFPDRKMERVLSNFQAIPQYDYNFRAETLPKAEIKGAGGPLSPLWPGVYAMPPLLGRRRGHAHARSLARGSGRCRPCSVRQTKQGR